ncbi:hypothetical protein [Rhodococcus rhodochrous]|uniref:hypothetical protein n=1 Tax=Rhodococcus rhodochrous TaxID=1829 RepID=UPI001780304E|nr:hypothetical protein [Rhodococcus rhodochrous]
MIVLFVGIGTQSTAAIIIALVIMAAAWLVTWPGDDKAIAERRERNDARIRKVARIIRR